MVDASLAQRIEIQTLTAADLPVADAARAEAFRAADLLERFDRIADYLRSTEGSEVGRELRSYCSRFGVVLLVTKAAGEPHPLGGDPVLCVSPISLWIGLTDAGFRVVSWHPGGIVSGRGGYEIRPGFPDFQSLQAFHEPIRTGELSQETVERDFLAIAESFGAGKSHERVVKL